jgi:N-acetylglucosaminyl-diphospho-decaprenol L-rhamnosyltransferase
MFNQDLTIIINTFNSDEKIFSCIESISPNIGIIIIENSNNIEFKNNIEKKYRNVKCELTGKNLGYANGNNLGLSKVKTKFSLILNPDTLIKKNSIENFFKTANTYPNFGIIGPAIQEEKDLKLKINTKNLIEVDNVKGFAMFLNMKQFKEIGFFDQNFFIYFEEIDLCRRLKKANKKIYLDPNIIINHVGGSSHNKSINFEMELSRNWHWMWSTFYYHKKYSGFIFALLKVIKKLISALFKILFYSIIFKENKKKIYYQRASGLLNSIIGNKSWYRPKVL